LLTLKNSIFSAKIVFMSFDNFRYFLRSGL